MPKTQGTTQYEVATPVLGATTGHVAARLDEALWNVALPTSQHIVYYSARSTSDSVEKEMQQALRLSGLLQNYRCDDVAEAYLFLSTHPQLIPLLEEAPLAIRQAYGPCELKLDILQDTEEGWTRMFLVVKSSLDVDSLLERSAAFGEHWIMPRLAAFGLDFSITEEPV